MSLDPRINRKPMNKDKLEVVYSIAVIVTIPILLIANTVFLASSTRNAFNSEIRRKADLVNSVIANTARDYIAVGDYDGLHKNLQDLENDQPAVVGVSVIERKEGGYVSTVMTDTAKSLQGDSSSLGIDANAQATLVFEGKWPIAKLLNVEYGNGRRDQAWSVMTPVINDEGNVIAAVSSNMLVADAREAIDKTFNISILILLASIVVIVAMLFRHFRMVGYVQLLAKQKELNQTMSDFLSVATHELKAPTTIIKGYLSNVMDGTYGPVDTKIQEQLQTAYAQTDRLKDLVNDLLNVSRIEQGRISYTITSVDSSSLIHMIASNYQKIAEGKGLELKMDIPSNLPLVHGDQGRLQEVFTNLIDNAVKYTARGSVTVSQRLEASRVITNVHDTGFGMSPEARKRLFQRFYRIKTKDTEGISGTGLGLWIIKQYIEAMGGTIEVESIEGVGSNFIVSMPIVSK